MRFVLRVAAWWVVITSSAILLLTLTSSVVISNLSLLQSFASMRVVLSPDETRLFGAWIFFVAGVWGAVELWRARRLGLVLGGLLLFVLFVGGSWNWWLGDRQLMALPPLAMHAAMFVALSRPAAWHACRAGL
jgi:hypothetical protein